MRQGGSKLYPVRGLVDGFSYGGREEAYADLNFLVFGNGRISGPAGSSAEKAVKRIMNASMGGQSINNAQPPYDVIFYFDNTRNLKKVTSVNGRTVEDIPTGFKPLIRHEISDFIKFDLNSYILCVNDVMMRIAEIERSFVEIATEMERHPFAEQNQTIERLSAYQMGNRSFVLIESCMLNIRKICEAIYIMSIPSHLHLFGRPMPEYRKDNIVDKFSDNPDYLLIPAKIIAPSKAARSFAVNDVESFISRYYKLSSEWIHSAVPYRQSHTKFFIANCLNDFTNKFKALFVNHLIKYNDDAVLVRVPFDRDYLLEFYQAYHNSGTYTISGSALRFNMEFQHPDNLVQSI